MKEFPSEENNEQDTLWRSEVEAALKESLQLMSNSESIQHPDSTVESAITDWQAETTTNDKVAVTEIYQPTTESARVEYALPLKTPNSIPLPSPPVYLQIKFTSVISSPSASKPSTSLTPSPVVPTSGSESVYFPDVPVIAPVHPTSVDLAAVPKPVYIVSSAVPDLIYFSGSPVTPPVPSLSSTSVPNISTTSPLHTPSATFYKSRAPAPGPIYALAPVPILPVYTQETAPPQALHAPVPPNTLPTYFTDPVHTHSFSLSGIEPFSPSHSHMNQGQITSPHSAVLAPSSIVTVSYLPILPSATVPPSHTHPKIIQSQTSIPALSNPFDKAPIPVLPSQTPPYIRLSTVASYVPVQASRPTLSSQVSSYPVPSSQVSASQPISFVTNTYNFPAPALTPTYSQVLTRIQDPVSASSYYPPLSQGPSSTPYNTPPPVPSLSYSSVHLQTKEPVPAPSYFSLSPPTPSTTPYNVPSPDLVASYTPVHPAALDAKPSTLNAPPSLPSHFPSKPPQSYITSTKEPVPAPSYFSLSPPTPSTTPYNVPSPDLVASYTPVHPAALDAKPSTLNAPPSLPSHFPSKPPQSYITSSSVTPNYRSAPVSRLYQPGHRPFNVILETTSTYRRDPTLSPSSQRDSPRGPTHGTSPSYTKPSAPPHAIAPRHPSLIQQDPSQGTTFYQKTAQSQSTKEYWRWPASKSQAYSGTRSSFPANISQRPYYRSPVLLNPDPQSIIHSRHSY